MIKVLKVDLLDKFQYEEYKDIIPPISEPYWIKPKYYELSKDEKVPVVYPTGEIKEVFALEDNIRVRPILYLKNSQYKGKTIIFDGFKFYILGNIAICKSSLCNSCFGNICRDDGVRLNDWDYSDIKIYLNTWYAFRPHYATFEEEEQL